MNPLSRFVVSLGLSLLASLAIAAPPQTINYQGVLTDPGGTTINTPVAMTFRLYNAATGGAALWTETQLSVNVVNGKFNAVLGSVPASPLTLPFDVPYWLTVAINADAEMTPRQPLTASAYAFRAAMADTVSSTASIAGSQITGPLTTATIPSAQITGPINAATATTAGALSGTIAGSQVTGVLTTATIAGSQVAGAIVQGGNTLGVAMSVGTKDNNDFSILANNVAAFRVLPASTPNLIGGSVANFVTAGAAAAVVSGGGSSGTISDPITGGSCGTSCANRVTDYGGSVGGGVGNQAGNAAGATTDAIFATVGGGLSNTANGDFSTVGGGQSNTASGFISTVGGGNSNTASGTASTVSGGRDNFATGVGSTVGGGMENIASGVRSLAVGSRAKAVHDNSFVWGGSMTLDSGSIAVGDFVVFAPTHVRFYTGPTGAVGCILSSASGWACSSDRNLKTNIKPIDAKAILRSVAAMPVSSWNMKDMPGVTQIGPMAQDFFAAFHLGANDTMISTTDAQGVALAAIQGLNQVMNEKDVEIKRQRARIEILEAALAAIQSRLGMR